MSDNIANFFKNVATSMVNGMYTAAPAIVTNIDLAKFQCDVQLKYKLKGKEIKVYNIPIATLASDGSAVMMAPKIGDVVLLLFTKHSLRDCLTNKEVKDAIVESVTFKLDNALVIAGLFTATSTVPSIQPEEILIYHKDQSEIRLKKGGNIELKSPTEIRFKAPKVYAETDHFEVV